MTLSSWFWVLWAAAGLAIEGTALWLANKHTLSQNLRPLVTRDARIHRVTLALWVGFSVWFAAHIWG